MIKPEGTFNPGPALLALKVNWARTETGTL
jgi:hypothetical protein